MRGVPEDVVEEIGEGEKGAFFLNPFFEIPTGEEAGTLDTDMGNWSRKFQENAESAMKMASVMVPEILYFFIMPTSPGKSLGSSLDIIRGWIASESRGVPAPRKFLAAN